MYFQDMRTGTQGTKLVGITASPAKWTVKPSHFPSFLPHGLLSSISFCLFFSADYLSSHSACFHSAASKTDNLQGFTRSSMLAPHCNELPPQIEISLQLRSCTLSPISCKQGLVYMHQIPSDLKEDCKAFIQNQFLQMVLCQALVL